MHLFDQLHEDWKLLLVDHRDLMSEIEERLIDQHVAPEFEQILRGLTHPIDSTKVVIFGQDPYPTSGHANGLAFSVNTQVQPIPASLRNIYKELSDDLHTEPPNHGDLSHWFDQGVLLVNRILTTQVGESLAHEDYGWQVITDRIARELGTRQVVAILWGKSAQQLSSYFRVDWVVTSVHPSPLSAHRGFFGSKPFSRANAILVGHGISPIKWA